jgi:hypothetical protein
MQGEIPGCYAQERNSSAVGHCGDSVEQAWLNVLASHAQYVDKERNSLLGAGLPRVAPQRHVCNGVVRRVKSRGEHAKVKHRPHQPGPLVQFRGTAETANANFMTLAEYSSTRVLNAETARQTTSTESTQHSSTPAQPDDVSGLHYSNDDGEQSIDSPAVVAWIPRRRLSHREPKCPQQKDADAVIVCRSSVEPHLGSEHEPKVQWRNPVDLARLSTVPVLHWWE